MSNNDNPTLITAVPNDPETEVVEKQNPAKRAWNYVKSHKKAAFAVAGLGALVVVSSMLGKESDSNDPVSELYSELDDETREALEADTVTN